MFGSIEQPRSWARHLVVTRELQKETGGFTEFVGLPFVHMAAPLYLQRKARRGPTFREVVLMHAIARIAYRGWIDNIQGSWVKLGLDGMTQLLQAGVNDAGGTLMDENISRAAGATHGSLLTEDDLRAIVEPLGRTRGPTHDALRPRRGVGPGPGGLGTCRQRAHNHRSGGCERALVGCRVEPLRSSAAGETRPSRGWALELDLGGVSSIGPHTDAPPGNSSRSQPLAVAGTRSNVILGARRARPVP